MFPGMCERVQEDFAMSAVLKFEGLWKTLQTGVAALASISREGQSDTRGQPYEPRLLFLLFFSSSRGF